MAAVFSAPLRTALVLALIFCMGGLIQVTSATATVNQTCTTYMRVGDVAALNAAIDCFNGQTSGSFVIELTQTIALEEELSSFVPIKVPVETTAIDNSSAATLTFNGIGTYALDGKNEVRPLTITDGNVTLNGVWIVNGGGNDYGGGIYNAADGNLTLAGSFIRNNSAKFGGGIFNHGELSVIGGQINDNDAQTGGGLDNAGTVTINDAAFFDNSAAHGGAIFSAADNIKLTNSTLTVNNTLFVRNGESTNGGGIYNEGTATITGGEFKENSATWGGAIYNGTESFVTHNRPPSPNKFRATMIVEKSRIVDNSALSGGGIYNLPGRDGTSVLDLVDSTLSENIATRFGGGGIRNISGLALFQVTLSDNSAVENGGGIENYGQMTLSHSTLSQNTTSQNGGGLFNKESAIIDSSTFSGNRAAGGGGGIQNSDADSNRDPTLTINTSTFNGNAALRGKAIENLNKLTLTNSILSSNEPTAIALCATYANSIVTISDSLIEDASCTRGVETNIIVGQNALLGALQDNGGPTSTHALLQGSPAINAGNSATCEAEDQRGEPRDGSCDMGAYEAAATPLAVEVACDPNAQVSTALQLDGAIRCFNLQTSGAYTVTLAADVTLTTALEPVNNKSAAQLTLTGDTQYGINGGGAVRVLTIYDGHLVLKDIDIVNGSSSANGGGLYNSSENLTLNQVTFSGNSADSSGGGMINFGFATILNSTYAGNRASNNGGGLYNAGDGVLTIIDTTFSTNSAENGAGMINFGDLSLDTALFTANSATGSGGGLYTTGDNLVSISGSTYADNTAINGAGIMNFGQTIGSKTTLTNNRATQRGGGIYNTAGGELDLSELTFLTNAATDGGGGLYNSGTLTLSSSKIQENESEFGGGLFHIGDSGSMTVIDTDFVVNTGSQAGGGIYSSAALTITRSSFFGNNGGTVLGPDNVGLGGGLYNDGAGVATVDNTTFSNNYAGNAGGGLFTNSDAATTLINTTLGDNIAGDGDGASIFSQGTMTVTNSILAYGLAVSECVGVSSINSSLVEDGTCGITSGVDGNLTGDPLLGDKADSDNGGPTSIRTLLAGSNAIDAGESGICTSAPISGVDQRGVSRDANCDLGAYEFNGDAVIASWRSTEVTVAEDAGTVSLTVELHKASAEPITVEYASSSGTATSGIDFTAASGTLTFAPGETSKTIEVSIQDDALGESTENFRVTLSNPTNTALGNPKQILVNLIDDDQPSLTFGLGEYRVSEAGGSVVLTLQLNRASDSEVTVDYLLRDETAAAGSDYTTQTGTLLFEAGQTSIELEIAVLSDREEELDETFSVQLSNPTGAGFGTFRETTVTILESSQSEIYMPMIMGN